MRFTRFGPACAAILLVFVLAALPTFAGSTGKGDLAPAWVGKTFINSEELTLRGLRGRLVFIEYFGTT